jgi:hypothetical protein
VVQRYLRDIDSPLTGVLARVPGEKAGSYRIIIGTLSAGSNYTVTLNPETFEITAKTLTATDVTVTGISPAYTYTAFAITPAPSVICGVPLTAGTDYDVVYSDNLTVGTAKVTITLKGNYSGTVTLSFEIEPATLKVRPDFGQSKMFGDDDPALTYTTSGWLGSDNLSLMKDNLSRVVGEDVGTYEILAGSLSAGKNYTISLDHEKFEITAKVILPTDPLFQIENVPPQQYTGRVITPEPAVKYDGKDLIPGTDFDYIYANNINVGKNAQVTVVFKGNYSGSVTKTFEIIPMQITITVFATGQGKVEYSIDGGAFQSYIGPFGISNDSDVVFRATGTSPFVFSHWIFGSEYSVDEVTGYLTFPSDTTVYVTFLSSAPGANKYITVTVSAGGPAEWSFVDRGVTVIKTGNGVAPKNAEITFMAFADIGYQFSYWTGDVAGTYWTVSSSSTKDITAIAEFVEDQDAIRVTVNFKGNGTVALWINGNYAGTYDSSFSFVMNGSWTIGMEASASRNWEFSHWIIGGFDNASATVSDLMLQDGDIITVVFNSTDPALWVYILIATLLCVLVCSVCLWIAGKRRNDEEEEEE